MSARFSRTPPRFSCLRPATGQESQHRHRHAEHQADDARHDVAESGVGREHASHEAGRGFGRSRTGGARQRRHADTDYGHDGEAYGPAAYRDGTLEPPADGVPKMAVPTELVPRCPVCGEPMSMNLRADDTFVEDKGWHEAALRYQGFLDAHTTGRALYLELGVGGNTPSVIKYPFWRRTYDNPEATYACVNFGEAFTAREIVDRSIVVQADLDAALDELLEVQHD